MHDRIAPRVHLEGWDLAAACVQQHMSAVGVGLGGTREDLRGDARDAADEDADRDGRGDAGAAAGHTVVLEQRLVQLDAPQLRLEIVANEVARAGGFSHLITQHVAWQMTYYVS